MTRRALLASVAACAALACRDGERTVPRYNLPVTGAPLLPGNTLPRLTGDGGLGVRVIEDRLPEEATRTFRTLASMWKSPRWKPFARIIQAQTEPLYARAPGKRPRKRPHDITVTQYFARRLPEIYGVEYVSWCGADYVGTLAYVESYLLLAQQKGRLDLLAVHQPACGSVGDRTVSFVELLPDGGEELVETYVEDSGVGDDFQEVRVFTQTPRGLVRVADIRNSSPVKFFHVEYRRNPAGERDVVTTHIEIEKALGRLREKPCWDYRYFEVESTHRFDPKVGQFVFAGKTRRRLPPRVALDLSGGEVPEGSCEG